MSSLLEEIRTISEHAAHKLEAAGYHTDSYIGSLKRKDLLKLLPGDDQLRVRKKVYEVICRTTPEKPISAVLTELQCLMSNESLKAALTDSGSLVNYLCILKKSKCEINHVKKFLDAHLDLLERLNTNLAEKGNEATVRYKMVISGNTLDTHFDLLKKVNGRVPGSDSVSLQLQETKHDEESQVTIVFCPVVSRLGTDVQAALMDISDDKPVILVVMYHSHIPKSHPVPVLYPNVVLAVTVFFYGTENGLLECKQNSEAISALKIKLLEYNNLG